MRNLIRRIRVAWILRHHSDAEFAILAPWVAAQIAG